MTFDKFIYAWGISEDVWIYLVYVTELFQLDNYCKLGSTE